MLKKIKDLTSNEQNAICDKFPLSSCAKCPLAIYMFDHYRCALHLEKTLRFCLERLENKLNKEVEVEE